MSKRMIDVINEAKKAGLKVKYTKKRDADGSTRVIVREIDGKKYVGKEGNTELRERTGNALSEKEKSQRRKANTGDELVPSAKQRERHKRGSKRNPLPQLSREEDSLVKKVNREARKRKKSWRVGKRKARELKRRAGGKELKESLKRTLNMLLGLAAPLNWWHTCQMILFNEHVGDKVLYNFCMKYIKPYFGNWTWRNPRIGITDSGMMTFRKWMYQFDEAHPYKPSVHREQGKAIVRASEARTAI